MKFEEMKHSDHSDCNIGPYNGSCSHEDHVEVIRFSCGCEIHRNETFWSSDVVNHCSIECAEQGIHG